MRRSIVGCCIRPTALLSSGHPRSLAPATAQSLSSSPRPFLPCSPIRHRSRPRQAGIATDALLHVLAPPAVFVGLFVSLWAYKCLMMVLFQNKIIYMPSMPPFSRREDIADYAKLCAPYGWREESIKSLDSTRLAVCVGEEPGVHDRADNVRHVVVVYFQGNGSSSPPRLPMLTNVLKAVPKATHPIRLTMIVPSYRGYWKSRGKPSEVGIRSDGQAAVKWAQEYASNLGPDTALVLWGQSLGAAVALSATLSSTRNVDGLVLETPFTSMKDMLVALYPQKWLPYRYLWPFLTSNWDNSSAIKRLDKSMHLLLVISGKDEVVPYELGRQLVAISKQLGLNFQEKEVAGALHHEATSRREGREAVANFLRKVAVD